MPDLFALSFPMQVQDGGAIAALKGIEAQGQRGGATLQRYGNAARQASGALLMIASTGKLTAESMKGLVTQASAAAFAFGPAGAFAGAIALAGVAIHDHFKRAREEAEKTKKAAMDAARQIRYEVNLTRAAERAAEQERLVVAKREELDAAKAKLRRLEDLSALAEQVGPTRVILDAQEAVAKVTSELIILRRERDAANSTVAHLAKAEGDLARATALVAEQTKVATAANDDFVASLIARLEFEREMARRRARRTFAAPGTPEASGAEGIAARNQARIRSAMAELERALGPIVSFIDGINREIAASLADSIAGGISAGITTAIQSGSIGKGIEALGRAFFMALGNMIRSIGEQMLMANVLIKKAITFLGGPLGIAASIGLIALGSAISGLASGGGRGGDVAASGPRRQLTDTQQTFSFGAGGFSSVSPGGAVVVHNTFVGPNDPVIQRTFSEIAEKAARRGRS